MKLFQRDNLEEIIVIPHILATAATIERIQLKVEFGGLQTEPTVEITEIIKEEDAAKTQQKIDEYKKKTGAVEIAVSKEEQKVLTESMGQKTNPVPDAVFNYISKGVAVTAKSAQADEVNEVVLRVDPETQVEYKRFTRPDGTTLDIMILP